MTEPAAAQPGADDAMRRRVEELQRRRAGSGRVAPDRRNSTSTRAAGEATTPATSRSDTQVTEPNPTLTPTLAASMAAADRSADGAPVAAAALSPSRPNRKARRARPHVAKGARVGAAGVGFASMFGLVALMGFANGQSDTDQVNLVMEPVTTEEPTATSPVVVVVHRPEAPAVDPGAPTTDTVAAASPGGATATGAAPTGSATAAAPVPSASAAPAPTPAAPAATAAPTPAAPPVTAAPIQLTAPPVVTPAPAPVAPAPPITTTRGSG